MIVRTRHGTPHTTGIDTDFIASGDYAQLKSSAEVLQGMMRVGATVRRGERSAAVLNFKDALDWLLSEARDAVSIQRYKGLGEMNPLQLWNTTMDPERRTLLQVEMEDAIAADQVFQTLMGDEVEPRRLFIEENALDVRFLDI